jgi:hypothetical protein
MHSSRDMVPSCYLKRLRGGVTSTPLPGKEHSQLKRSPGIKSHDKVVNDGRAKQMDPL